MLELREDCRGGADFPGPNPDQGLFETILVRAGKPVFLKRHLERLAAGLSFLKMECLPPEVDIRRAMTSCLVATATRDGAIKLLACDRLLHVLPRAATPFSPPVRLGISRAVIRASRAPLVRFKTVARARSDALTAEAARTGVFDCLALNEKGHLTDGGRTNLFLIHDDRALTPPVSDGCLPGIARAVVLDTGLAREQSLSREHLRPAQAVFLTNALIGVLAVDKIAGSDREYAEHPLIREIRTRYEQAITADLEYS